MTTFFAILIATAFLGQVQPDRTATGEVVDDQGKPVAGAQVVLFAPPVVYGKGDAVEVRATSDPQGKFSLQWPPLKRVLINGVNLLAYRPGLAITAHEVFTPPHRLM